MKNYLNFELDIKDLENELEGLKDPYNQDGLSEVNTTKISKYKIHFEKAKISKYDKISRFSKIFRNLVRRNSAIFQVFTHFLQFFRIDFEKS